MALAFLTMPIVAIFVDSPPGDLLAALGEEGALDALWLSLRTTAAALAIIVVIGTPAAYLLATRRFRGRALVITLVELPLVLPPAVAGIALLAAIGPSLTFTTGAVVVALTFVASPFYLRQAPGGVRRRSTAAGWRRRARSAPPRRVRSRAWRSRRPRPASWPAARWRPAARSASSAPR